jgi:hypothetical protein
MQLEHHLATDDRDDVSDVIRHERGRKLRRLLGSFRVLAPDRRLYKNR